MTYSIVARDETSVGVAVQSHYFAVGTVVTWAEPGVGAVATQAFADPSYGPLGLALLRERKSADKALRALLASDDEAARRQVAMIGTSGPPAVHTGERCLAVASHVWGPDYSCQANMMWRDTVPEAMSRAFRACSGSLPERLMAALDAAEAEGGDVRGRQSAALLVVSCDPADSVSGRLVDLRVDDHASPLEELRRLLGIKRAYDLVARGDALMASGDLDGADRAYGEAYLKAQELAPGNPEFAFWRAVILANFGRIDDARQWLEQAFSTPTGHWRELLRRLPQAGLLDAEIAGRLEGC